MSTLFFMIDRSVSEPLEAGQGLLDMKKFPSTMSANRIRHGIWSITSNRKPSFSAMAFNNFEETVLASATIEAKANRSR
jgi:hypothetical protein